ncbi:MAG: ATP-binding protein [Planctomycetaceae bacterium]|jgi:AAA15 family ATPase/GTPase|nr:ATP-binding protein [Planctomycetaceae bacterium]
MQKIEIKNFGTIKRVDLDIKDYTNFIGQQASGKSTIAKLFYYFRKFNVELVKLLSPPLGYNVVTDEKITADQLSASDILQRKLTCKTFRDYWHGVFLEQDFDITYKYSDDTYLTLICRNEKLSADYSTDIIELFEDSKNQLMNIRKQGKLKSDYYDSPEFIAYHNRLVNKANILFGDWNMKFVPAGRHVFPSLKDQPVFIDDIIVRNFSSEIDYIRSEWEKNKSQDIDSPNTTKYKQIKKLVQSILKGNYSVNEDDEGILPYNFSKVIPLVHTSAGQQESLWVLLSILNTFYSDEKYSYIIEEPEAHLFPEAQRNIMYVLTYYANLRQNQLMLTTHSPYILTPLNNLLQAYILGQDESKRDRVAEIIDSDLWLNPERFECYYVDNGTIESIVDREVNMMYLEKLDKASSIGNEEYDKLSELED